MICLSESQLQKKAIKHVQNLGGVVYRNPPGEGRCDVEMFLPNGKVLLLEFKRNKKAKTGIYQALQHKKLNNLGHNSYYVDSWDCFLNILQKVQI